MSQIIRVGREGHEWFLEIGDDLREVRGNGTLGTVVAHHHLRAALGISGKLTDRGTSAALIGGTTVFILSREAAKSLNPKSRRPHRMMAVCNHCGRNIPTGRFGHHLKIHRS